MVGSLQARRSQEACALLLFSPDINVIENPPAELVCKW